MALRYGAGFHPRSGRSRRWGETIRVGDVTVTFHPAGHVLGSAQIAIEAGRLPARRVGRLQARPRPDLPPFEPVRCHAFITEATFGLPVFRHPDRGRTRSRKLLASRALFPERTHIRRRLRARQGPARDGAAARGRLRPADLHPWRAGEADRPTTSEQRHRARRDPQGRGGRPRQARRARSSSARRARIKDLWARKFPDPVTAVGVRLDAGAGPGAPERASNCRSIVSDHADWDELCATVARDRLRGALGDARRSRRPGPLGATRRASTRRPLHLIGYGEEDARADRTSRVTRREPPHEPLRRAARPARLRARPRTASCG